MEAREEENNQSNQQNIWPNKPSDVSGSSTDKCSIEKWLSIYFGC